MSQELTKLERARLREGMWLGHKYRLGQLIAVDELAASYFAASTAGIVVEASVLNPEVAALPDFRAAFIRAARAPNGLSIPAFGGVQDSGVTEDGLPYIVGPEQLEGESLGDLVRRRGRTLPPSEALRIVGHLLACIAQAHAQGLVHGLLEPNHIFMGDDGTFKIRGLGLSLLRISALDALKLRAPWQSLPFVAPEVLRGEPPTPASDVWSMGAILFCLLTGELPYVASGELLLAAAQVGQTQLLSDVEPKAPYALTDLVTKATYPEPGRRLTTTLFGAKARTLGQAPDIAPLRFLGDSVHHAGGSGAQRNARRALGSIPDGDHLAVPLPPPSLKAISSPPGLLSRRPTGGYSQITNAVTAVSNANLQRISSPPPSLAGKRQTTLHTQSTRPPKRG